MINAIQPKFSASCCQFSGSNAAQQQAPKFQGQLLDQGKAAFSSAYQNVQDKIAPLQQGLRLGIHPPV